jgi:hypothetical protein
VFGVVVGLYQPLADNEREPPIRPYLSPAVASEDKEKPFGFFFGLLPAHLSGKKAGGRGRQHSE